MTGDFLSYAKTLYGLESILEQELIALGAKNTQQGIRNVSFVGDMGFLYKTNLALRTAIRILVPIATFKIKNEQDLYQKIYNISWTDYISPTLTFSVDSVSASSTFMHSHYLSLKVKDAIVDRSRADVGHRPNVDINRPDIRVNVHIQQDNTCTISLDSSGSSLHLRGYKTAIYKAPLNEVLAAGLLLLSGWDAHTDFLDPMCGSGTLVIEAAMMATHTGPNLHRKTFGFVHWHNFDEELFQNIKESLIDKIVDSPCRIRASDIASDAILSTRTNADNALLSGVLEVVQQDFFASKKYNEDNPLHLVCNPPYDKRISIDVKEFYKAIGDTLKHHYSNTQSWILTADEVALKCIQLKSSQRIKLLNAQLASKFVRYDMYSGSKRYKL